MYLRTRFPPLPHPTASAISTVVNNPHKKSAPPKAHASVPSTPRVGLPRVRRKDFDPYLRVIGPGWEALQHNAELAHSESMRLEEFSIPDLLDQSDSRRTPLPPKLLPPLSSVPDISFRHDFDLGNPRMFDAVAEVSPSSTSRPTSPTATSDPSTLTHFLPLLEKLSHHADTVEQHLVHEIAPIRASLCVPNWATLARRARAAGCEAYSGEVRLAHLKEVQSGVRSVRGVTETVGVVRGLVDNGQWGPPLDGVDELRVMWEGKTESIPVPAPPSPPSLQGSLLPSVAEEGPLVDEKDAVQRTEELVSPPAALDMPLSKLKAFAALPSQLHTLTQEITSSLTSDLVATLKVDLLERIHKNDLDPGLFISSFDPGEDPLKESTDASQMRHGFLRCIEGLQALNNNITMVIEGARPPGLPAELSAIHDSLFDTLFSTAESANVSASKVLSTRVEQHVKLDLREFVEIFNECWSFVVRFEVTCKRMIVGLRGVVVSQIWV
ncbi:hypothetical protein DFH94DRAFT_686902 [Russula ochroleuca]|uniref:Uncharacterized protein n=1 Tax=Russula ochroleuca TaxID=152965 RepID=A0A9P5JV51_9AGAM|nr:hypothetical protein DFH94DRAFT_686902 [Russula ochroleuca]